ncbi:hypothetical protein B0T10DRAFT_104897 [Thelonectria olida]|uniref:Secreted protein n=1 Tax=Thelonectria olida TaxID=1576542 RepID=A0A9P8WGC3_9HYPO|nr:hypothetical protein B0T10DRAFT_104897 [Thelonectria olida]
MLSPVFFVAISDLFLLFRLGPMDGGCKYQEALAHSQHARCGYAYSIMTRTTRPGGGGDETEMQVKPATSQLLHRGVERRTGRRMRHEGGGGYGTLISLTALLRQPRSR